MIAGFFERDKEWILHVCYSVVCFYRLSPQMTVCMLKPGTYLFVEHPGLNTAEMGAIGHTGYENVAEDRDAVTEVFVSEKVKKAIKRLGIKLISYADLKKAGKK